VAFPQQEAGIERRRLTVIRHCFLHRPVDTLGLEEDHRIRIADRRQQQAVSPRRRGGDHHADAGDMGKKSLRALRMMLGRMDAAAVGRADHHRASEPPAGAVAQPAGVVQHLIDGRIDEAHELELDHRAKTLRTQAHGEPGEERLRQRRVDHAFGAEALQQALRGAKDPAVGSHILPKHENAVVLAHCPRQGKPYCLDQGNLAHPEMSPSSEDWDSASRCASSSRGNSA
jgi:hypothetical protein